MSAEDKALAAAKAAAKAKAYEVVVPDWVKAQKHWRIKDGICQVGLDIVCKLNGKVVNTVCLWVGIGIVGNYLQVDGIDRADWERRTVSIEHPLMPAYYDNNALFLPTNGRPYEHFAGYHIFFLGKYCIMVVMPPKIMTFEQLCRVREEVQSVFDEDYYAG